jgi:thiol-disulfide isomerase/thioredoxin
MKKYIIAFVISLFFCAQLQAQVTVAYKKVATDTNTIVYDEQGNALRYYQYIKLVNSGDYTIRYNGPPGDPGVQGHLKKLDDAGRARLLAIVKERMSIKSDKVKEGNALDMEPLQDALDGVDFTKKVVVLVFWDSGCPPCTESFAGINDFFAQLPDPQDVILVALTTDDKETAIAALKTNSLLNAKQITNSSHINTAYDVSTLPSYIVADKGHIIRLALTGASGVTLSAIKAAVTSALAE